MTSTLADLRPTAADRAGAGALLFDRARRGWARRITRPIEVDSTRDCPVAQAFGQGSWGSGYWRVAKRIGSDPDSNACGFVSTRADHDRQALNAAWEAEVTARRTRRRWQIRWGRAA